MANPNYSTAKEKCCIKGMPSKDCSKPDGEESQNCSTDYCNPFQICSTTPILIAPAILFQGCKLPMIKKYPDMHMSYISDFAPKHWQPPKV